MKKIFVIYGHYNNKSFTCAIKDTFIDEARKNDHEIDIVDLYKDKFNPVFAGIRHLPVLGAGAGFRTIYLIFYFFCHGTKAK